ncbi:hypothetical protein D3C86_1409500 [compost metagenome]
MRLSWLASKLPWKLGAARTTAGSSSATTRCSRPGYWSSAPAVMPVPSPITSAERGVPLWTISGNSACRRM